MKGRLKSKWNTRNTEKSNKRKYLSFRALYKLQRIQKSHPEILEYLFWKIQENAWKTSAVVHFDLILADKSTPPRTAAFKIIWESCRDGFFCYRDAVTQKC